MIKQYPYTLEALIQTEAVYNEATGEWVGGAKEWETIGKCRDEINGSGAKITTQDGGSYVYSAVVYAPLGTRVIPRGTEIRVSDVNGVRMSGNVVRFGKEQLHVRIWL